jgi:hypothetical protein
MIYVECNKHYTISWSIPITDFFKFNLKIFLSDLLTGYVLYLHSWKNTMYSRPILNETKNFIENLELTENDEW